MMQLLQEEQLATERKFLYKRSCVPRSLSLKKKQKIITPSSPAKKSLDEMPTLQMKRNGAVSGIGKKIPILIRFAQNLIRIQSQNLSHQD